MNVVLVPHPPMQSACTRPDSSVDQEQFLKLLPTIRRIARYAFRRLAQEVREEALQEVVVSAWCAWHTLARQGRGEVAFATSLAGYAIAHYRVGRRIAHRMNADDVSSAYCQRRRRIRLDSLHHYDAQECRWQEIQIEDGRATPADIAATRIDFEDWLSSLSPRMRALAEALATGETTNAAARLFRVSAGRVSQVRRKLMEAWNEFHSGEENQPAFAVA